MEESTQCKTRKELANEYGVSLQTFIRWIKTIPGLKIPPRHRITPRQISIIKDYLG